MVTGSKERRRLWGEALAAAGIVLGSDISGPSDVVLTDLPGAAGDTQDTQDSAGARHDQGLLQVAAAPNAASGSDDHAAAIGVESNESLRVRLPHDATPREIVLACLLLAQTVRLLRRQRDAGEREARWKQLAESDPLTGLLNRRAFTERVVELLQAASPARACCLALIDLDRFKPINDELGHSAGDAVLQQAAARLAASVRKGDLVCRLGGDEFAVALFDVSSEIAGGLVERLRQALAADHLPGVQDVADSRPLSASAGWTMLSMQPASATDRQEPPSSLVTSALFQAAMEAADAKLRAAKSAGRDRTIPC